MPDPVTTLADQIARARRRKQKTPAKGAMPLAPAPVRQDPGTLQRRTISLPGKRPTGGSNLHDWNDGRGARHSISLAQHQRNARVKANDRNPLYNPTLQLSGDALAGAADDLVEMEYGPQRAALGRQLSNETTQGGALIQRAQDYGNQLASDDAKLPGQVAAIGELLGQKLTGNTNASMDAIRAQLANARDTAAADNSGMNTGLQTAGAEKEAQAQIGRLAELGQTSRDTAALNTNAFQQLATLSGQARGQMGQEVQGQLINRLANQQMETRAKQTDLATQEGQARTATTQQLRQQAFENLITQKGLDIKGDELEAETAQAKAKLAEQAKTRRMNERARTADRRSREQIAADNRRARADADRAAREGKDSDINKYGVSNGRWKGMTERERMKIIERADRTSRSRGGNGSMPASAQGTRNGIDNALIDVDKDPKLKRHADAGDYDRIESILKKRGAPPIVAKAARELAERKFLSPSTIAALRRAKVKVPKDWINPPGPYLAPGAAGPPVPS